MIEYPDDYGSHDSSHSHTNDWEVCTCKHLKIGDCVSDYGCYCAVHATTDKTEKDYKYLNVKITAEGNSGHIGPTTDTAERKCNSSPFCSHNTNGRDLDKPCSVSIPATDTSDWEKDFEMARPDATWMPKQVSHEEESEVRFFGYKYFSKGNIHEVTDWGHIKSFIRKVVEQAREDNRKENDAVAGLMEIAKKAGKASALSEVRIMIEKLTRYGTVESTGNKWAYFCDDVEDILTQLSNDTK